MERELSVEPVWLDKARQLLGLIAQMGLMDRKGQVENLKRLLKGLLLEATKETEVIRVNTYDGFLLTFVPGNRYGEFLCGIRNDVGQELIRFVTPVGFDDAITCYIENTKESPMLGGT